MPSPGNAIILPVVFPEHVFRPVDTLHPGHTITLTGISPSQEFLTSQGLLRNHLYETSLNFPGQNKFLPVPKAPLIQLYYDPHHTHHSHPTLRCAPAAEWHYCD